MSEQKKQLHPPMDADTVREELREAARQAHARMMSLTTAPVWLEVYLTGVGEANPAFRLLRRVTLFREGSPPVWVAHLMTGRPDKMHQRSGRSLPGLLMTLDRLAEQMITEALDQ